MNDIDGTQIRLATQAPGVASIYSGHKLAVGRDTLSRVLSYYFDRSRGRFLFTDYTKAEGQDGRLFHEEAQRGLERSYETLLEAAAMKLGSFRKIHIYRHENP